MVFHLLPDLVLCHLLHLPIRLVRPLDEDLVAVATVDIERDHTYLLLSLLGNGLPRVHPQVSLQGELRCDVQILCSCRG